MGCNSGFNEFLHCNEKVKMKGNILHWLRFVNTFKSHYLHIGYEGKNMLNEKKMGKDNTMSK